MNPKCLLFWFRRQIVLNARAAQCEKEYQALVRRLQGPRLVRAS